MPHIIHLTDGAITDAHLGDARWNELTGKLSRIDGRGNVEKKIATILHFVSPKGCVDGFVDVGGRKMSGQALLAELSGKGSVYELGSEIGSFEQLVRLITVVITKITKNFATPDAMANGLAGNGAVTQRAAS